MATIQYVAAGTFTSGAAALSVPAPAGILAGDLLLLVCESANQAITAPTGYTEIGAQASQATGTAAAAGGVRLAVFYKFTTGTEANITVADSGDHTTARIHAFRNVNYTNPFNATASGIGTPANTAVTMPAVTTTVPNAMIVLCLANDRDIASTNNFAANAVNANLTTITERTDQTVTTGAGGGIALWTAFKTTVGSTGTTTATNGAAVTYGYLTIALRPEARRFLVS